MIYRSQSGYAGQNGQFAPINLKKAIEATENTEDTEKARVSKENYSISRYQVEYWSADILSACGRDVREPAESVRSVVFLCG